jgi:GntR family transcriptional regulator/MocR family aminotransferase
VIYAGTASKTLAPALRLAWLVLPRRLVEPVAEAKLLADRNSSAFDQLAFAEFITSGAYDRHVRRARLVYRRRRERLVEALQRHVPDVHFSGAAGGLHAILELRPGSDEDAVVGAAARRGLALIGLQSFRADPNRPDDHGPALAIGYATPPDHAFTTAVSRLVATLTDRP